MANRSRGDSPTIPRGRLRKCLLAHHEPFSRSRSPT
jgi:hypothetical protein